MAGTPYLIAEPAGKGWAGSRSGRPDFPRVLARTSLLFRNAAILAPSFTP